MKILIVGGMGIIGSGITESAAKKQYDVFVLSRRKLYGRFLEMGIKGISGDWKDDRTAESVLAEEFDVVVDTIAMDREQLIRSMNLCEGKCKHYIFISTDSVYNHPTFNIKEEAGIHAEELQWSYGRKKREAELYIIENKDKYSFMVSTIRPVVTYGLMRIPIGFASRKNEYTVIRRILSGKPVIAIEDNGSYHSICHSSTLGRVAVEMFCNPECDGQFYHISDDKVYTFDEIIYGLGQMLGVWPKVIHISSKEFCMLDYGKYCELVYDKEPNSTVDNSKAKELAGSDAFPLVIEETFPETIQYLENNYLALPDDQNYEFLTDSLILKCRRYLRSENEKRVAAEYIQGLSTGYKMHLFVEIYKRKFKYIVKKMIGYPQS